MDPGVGTRLTILDVLGRHTPGPVHPFARFLDEGTWAIAEVGCGALRRASFSRVRCETGELAGRYAGPEEAVRWVLAWPSYGKTFDGLDTAARAAVQEQAIEAMRTAGRLDYRYTFNCFVGMKPAD